VPVTRIDFNAALDYELEQHKEASRLGSTQKFGGHGLILDTGELKAANPEELDMVLRLHTATHLLQAGLRTVLGDHVEQKGSDISAKRLRFDFTHDSKLTPEQLQEVEDWVNDIIEQDLPVDSVELPLEKAKQTGALHFFGHKYPAIVKVYFVGKDLDSAVSSEFCGGPHINKTGMIGKIKIQKQESASAGIRRIKAILD
jgi:alanyl-tRNA synthetase